MKQFILKDTPDKNSIVRLQGDDYHYLVRVRRLAAGEYFPALLPDGQETLVQVQSVAGGELVGLCLPKNDISSRQPPDNCPLPPVFLFQALPKGDKMDLIVRQAAESGIKEIVPFASEFSVGKTKNIGQKFARWEKKIREARQQSGSKINTCIKPPVAMKELFDYWNKFDDEKLGLLFHHQACRGLENPGLHGYLSKYPKIIALAIGPEGGFSEKEVGLFLENGFKAMTIGDTILRTETAALFCSAAVKTILLERDSWEPKAMKNRNG